MSNQLDTTRARIRGLAKTARGSRTQKDLFGETRGISLNAYASFEKGDTWPRAAGLRRIEEVLGWAQGSIDNAISSEMAPMLITQAHMRGEVPFSPPTAGLDRYTEEQLIQEIADRAAHRSRYGLAASRDLGGVEPDGIEESA